MTNQQLQARRMQRSPVNAEGQRSQRKVPSNLAWHEPRCAQKRLVSCPMRALMGWHRANFGQQAECEHRRCVLFIATLRGTDEQQCTEDERSSWGRPRPRGRTPMLTAYCFWPSLFSALAPVRNLLIFCWCLGQRRKYYLVVLGIFVFVGLGLRLFPLV